MLPDLPTGVTKAHGFDPKREAAANRVLRATLPAVPGAQFVTVSDDWITADVSEPGWGGNSTDRTVAVGVETTWEYHLDNATKCQVAAALEVPLAGAGWAQDTLETSGAGGVANVRYSQFAKPGEYVAVSLGAPATSFAMRVQAHTTTTWLPTPQPSSPFSACHPDLPPSPPDTPVEVTAALAANQPIYAALPIPAGAALIEKTPEAATAMGSGNVAIGYGTSWRLQLPSGTGLCGSAATFEGAWRKPAGNASPTRAPPAATAASTSRPAPSKRPSPPPATSMASS